jgi:DNA-binding NarL/FixJ family response regulator
LENVILKALEKNPTRRFQSSGALAEALESTLPSNVAANAVAKARATDTMLTESPDGAPRSKRSIRVILADDHTLLRKTLANMLETRDDYVVVAEAGDGESALHQTLAILPDVLILDLNMPVKGGLEVLPAIRKEAPTVKVLVLTGREEDAYIVRALRAGAHGYILKSADEPELIEAINKVSKGQLYLGRGVAEKVVTGLLSGSVPDPAKLSEEEGRLLLYVAAGYENEIIARKMNMAMTDTIELLARTMNKLQAKDRYSAALKALRLGLILIEDLHFLKEE